MHAKQTTIAKPIFWESIVNAIIANERDEVFRLFSYVRAHFPFKENLGIFLGWINLIAIRDDKFDRTMIAYDLLSSMYTALTDAQKADLRSKRNIANVCTALDTRTERLNQEVTNAVNSIGVFCLGSLLIFTSIGVLEYSGLDKILSPDTKIFMLIAATACFVVPLISIPCMGIILEEPVTKISNEVRKELEASVGRKSPEFQKKENDRYWAENSHKLVCFGI